MVTVAFHFVPERVDERSRSPICIVVAGALVAVAVGDGVEVVVNVAIGDGVEVAVNVAVGDGVKVVVGVEVMVGVGVMVGVNVGVAVGKAPLATRL